MDQVSSLKVKFSLVRFPGTIIWEDTLVMGHESFTSMAIPRAFDLRELKYILWGVAFWISCSVSIDVLVSSRRKRFEWDLLMLLKRFFFYHLGNIRSKRLVLYLRQETFEWKGLLV